MKNGTKEVFKSILLESLPAFLCISLVVVCYFVYPSWKLLGLSPIDSIFFSFLYLLTIACAFKIFARISRREKGKIEETPVRKASSIAVLSVLIVLFGSLQLFYIGWPIVSGPDEPIRIFAALQQFELYNSLPGSVLFTHLGCCLLLVLALTAITVLPKIENSTKGWRKLLSKCVPLLIFVSIPVLLWVILQSPGMPTELGNARRWPPLGTILGVFSFSLSGVDEFAARLPALFFYCGTGFFVYRIIEKDLGPGAAVVGLAVCLASPSFFSHGHLNNRDIGGAFFLVLGVNSLLFYLKNGNVRNLGYVTFAVAAGFLERRPAGVLLIIVGLLCAVHLVINMRLKGSKKVDNIFGHIAPQIILASTVVVIVLPWILVTRGVRPYHFFAVNFSRLELLLAYLQILPRLFPWPMVFLLCTGILAAFLKRHWSGMTAVLSFLVLYILFTGDDPYWIPQERFAVLFIPFCSILISQNFAFIKSRQLGRLFFSIIIIFSINGLWGWSTDHATRGLMAKTTQTVSGYPYYPFKDLVLSLKKQKLKKGNILFPVFWQSAFPTYLRMYQIKGYVAVAPPWIEHTKRKTNLHKLRKLCKFFECQAVIVPFVWEKAGIATVFWVEDLKYSSILKNQVPGFNVLKVFSRKQRGLALIVPDRSL